MKNILPADLIAAQKFVYEPRGLISKNIKKEAESEEYGAFTFSINNRHILFRTGKITPNKIGQFVTLWKRIGNGSIQPYDIEDDIDLFLVSVRHKKRWGQFVFPKAVLYEKGILSKEGKGGKRAMRIYPIWDITKSQQAKKTQAWQLLYFFEISSDKLLDTRQIKKLFAS